VINEIPPPYPVRSKELQTETTIATEDKITKLFRMADDFYSFFNIL